MSSPLGPALAAVCAGLDGATAPWWIIGSAAVVLYGADTSVADVDVLCANEADADRLIAAVGGTRLPTGADPLFRSTVFGRATTTPLPIEVMAELTVRGAPVQLVTRKWVACGGMRVPVPARAELVALLRRFGRAKDLVRADLLAG